MNDLVKRNSELDVREVLVGEIVYDEPVEPRCCETCGHFHLPEGQCLPEGRPCGSYLCCIN